VGEGGQALVERLAHQGRAAPRVAGMGVAGPSTHTSPEIIAMPSRRADGRALAARRTLRPWSTFQLSQGGIAVVDHFCGATTTAPEPLARLLFNLFNRLCKSAAGIAGSFWPHPGHFPGRRLAPTWPRMATFFAAQGHNGRGPGPILATSWLKVLGGWPVASSMAPAVSRAVGRKPPARAGGS
jgi:hypothetical protein